MASCLYRWTWAVAGMLQKRRNVRHVAFWRTRRRASSTGLVAFVQQTVYRYCFLFSKPKKAAVTAAYCCYPTLGMSGLLAAVKRCPAKKDALWLGWKKIHKPDKQRNRHTKRTVEGSKCIAFRRSGLLHGFKRLRAAS